MKILLVGGFLGSGKTSFILKLAHHLIEDRGINNIVILENEIGEISVDDKVLKGSGYQVKGLFAGCVCCTLAGELPATVRQIERDINPDWMIMEATGVAFPYTIKENLVHALNMDCRIICLTDAQRWKRLYRAMANLFDFQLKDADVILVNKADLVDEAMLAEVMEAVKAINPEAEVVSSCANEAIPIELVDRIMSEE
ncbi:MAG: cobalamin biosynthesis protein P47K [Oscillospiraceae bacterium]|nr:cobalamin biosynthesis protein P47K [Oscillospiraceae bacterium]